MTAKFKVAVALSALFVLGLNLKCFAEDVTLVLAGQTHAMLYRCHCPVEPDGGIARRATLIQQLRKNNPNTLVVDSGSFFAGGPMDQGTLGGDLDKARSVLHLKAMDLMKYDAASLSPDEFNFGTKFLEENIGKTGIKFLGANIVFDKIAPYMLKRFGKVQVGVVGLVNPMIGSKLPQLRFIQPQDALKSALLELKKLNADLIVLISGLPEDENKALLSQNPEINVLIEGAKFAKEKVSINIGSTLVLAPRWEGRRLVAVTFSVKNKVVEVKNVEDIRVSDKLADDKQMLNILPQCFSDRDCKKEGSIAQCLNPGKPGAVCEFKPAPQLSLTVINKPDCRTCDTTGVINSLRNEFPGLKIETLDFPGAKAEKLIERLQLSYLPAYLLDKKVETERSFEKMKQSLEPKGEYYFLAAQATGIGYFLHRHQIPGRLDLFISLVNKEAGELLDTLKEFTPEVHFLANDDGEGFGAAGGRLEIEEYLRAVCVGKYHPGLFYNYITCRAKNIDTSWWDDCLADVDVSAVKTCAQGDEGKQLLKENILLNRELQIANGPTYLLDNEEIFGSAKIPKKEEFRKLLFKR
jgi:hypothetical protein